ncbi:hypothetical protein D3C84_505930 [compost metagenome]
MQREVPRHDGADHAHRFLAGIGQVIARQRRLDGAAVQLGGPAGEVTQGIDRALDIHVTGLGGRLAHVDGLDLGQLLGIGFDQVGQALDHPLAFLGLGLAPGAAVELGARRLYRTVQVSGGAHGNTGDQACGRRFDDVGSLAVAGSEPGAADEHFLGFAKEGLGGFADAEALQVVFDDRVHFLFSLTGDQVLVLRCTAGKSSPLE